MTFKELKEQLHHDFPEFVIEDNEKTDLETPTIFMLKNKLIVIKYNPNKNLFKTTPPANPYITVRVHLSEFSTKASSPADYLFIKTIIENIEQFT